MRSGSNFYASNAGSSSLSGYHDGGSGTLTALGNTATDADTVDAAVSSDIRFLYAQTGAHGVVDAFRIGSDGSLTQVGAVTVPGAVGGEGIVAGSPPTHPAGLTRRGPGRMYAPLNRTQRRRIRHPSTAPRRQVPRHALESQGYARDRAW